MSQRTVVVASLVAALIVAAVPAEAATRRYAVIVAENDSLDREVASLKYADDDGAMYYELLGNVVDDVTLLAVLDADTQRQHRGLAAKTSSPTLANLRQAIERVNKAMEADRRRGDTVIFYFIYAGHGAVGDGGEGYVNLADVRFTRSDLFQEVLAPSTASYNHLVIDACNSYFLVKSRGGSDQAAWRDDRSDDDHADEVQGFLAAEDLEKYPNTGVILSTSSAEETHEWEAYQAGVFSHEVRSALTGAADVNGDGRVEYSEVKAFVAAANAGIDDPKARLSIFAAAPSGDASAALVDLQQARFRHHLVVPSSTRGHLYLEDDRGVRYADFHHDGSRALVVALTAARYYYLRSSTRELRVDLGKPGVHKAGGKWRSIAVASRGATSDTYRHGLFATPFGADFYHGYVVSTGDVPVVPIDADTPSWLAASASAPSADGSAARPLYGWMWAAGGFALSAGVGAFVFDSLADRAYQDFQRDLAATGVADRGLMDSVQDRQTMRNVLIGVTVVAAATGLTLYLWDRHDAGRGRAAVSVAPTGDSTGFMIGVDGTF